MTPDDRRLALARIADEVAACRRCPLGATRTNAVPGEGHPDTEVVFVGEGPGFNEDQQGRPFVGAAGTLLNDLLRRIGWRRDEVFITNVVKCRPPANRDPEPHEIEACAPFLRRQLEVLDPAVVVTLGRHSLQTFRPGARIGQVHGTVQAAAPATGARSAVALAMYHPAAALRQNSLRETMLTDMARLPQALLDSRARRAPAADVVGDESGPSAGEPTPPVGEPTAAAGEATAAAGESSDPTDQADYRALEAVGVGATAADDDPDNQMELF